MGWQNLIILSVGFGLGLASRLLAQAVSKQSPHAADNRSKVVQPGRPVADQVSDPSLRTQLEYTQLAYQMASEMSQFKAGFLARTSHELRSPLNAVMSLHKLILSDLCDNPEEEREFVAQAQGAAEKMLALLDHLVKVAKVQHGTSPLQIQPVLLAELLEKVHSLTYLQAQDRSVRLTFEPPDPDLCGLADPLWLQHVLVSLIDGAIAQFNEGSIKVSSQVMPEAEQVQIWIEDQRSVEDWREAIGAMPHAEGTAALPPLTDVAVAREGGQMIDLPQFAKPSLGLTWIVGQTLMNAMQGELELMEGVGPNEGNVLTRIRCSVPWLLPEVDE